MNNEIEEGCIALVINGAMSGNFPTNIGKIVTVGKRVGVVKNFSGNTYWAVDKPMVTNKGNNIYYQLEENLQRLDDTVNTEDIGESISIDA